MNATVTQRLAKWYESKCNGEWEHACGVRIETVDNPGWRITIDLKGTPLEQASFATYEDKYHDEREWLRCWKDGSTFQAACGPCRIEDALSKFCDWAEAAE